SPRWRLWPSSWAGDSCAFGALTLLHFQCRPPSKKTKSFVQILGSITLRQPSRKIKPPGRSDVVTSVVEVVDAPIRCYNTLPYKHSRGFHSAIADPRGV